MALVDPDLLLGISERYVRASRATGALRELIEALLYSEYAHLNFGNFAQAATCSAEVVELNRLWTDMPCVAPIQLAAWRGGEKEVRETASEVVEAVAERGPGWILSMAEKSVAILELSLGNYGLAAAEWPTDWEVEIFGASLQIVEFVEAKVRGGLRGEAIEGLDHYLKRTALVDTPLVQGLRALSIALLEDDTEPESQFEVAIKAFEVSGCRLYLARARLLYGEWLRDRQRTEEAKVELHTALGMLETMGALLFAERARLDLIGLGDTATRGPRKRVQLSQQEAQVARLAATGATNAEIGSRMFLSPHTVDFHLRKVFKKVGINSRKQLVGTMLEDHWPS
jgi:DNA-binding CsgD family transcriptional regulator